MINFIGNRKTYLKISGALILVTLLVALIFGVHLDIQFKGGSIITYSYEGTVSDAEIASASQVQLQNAVSVQLGTNAGTGMKTFTITLAKEQGLDSQQQTALTAMLQEKYPDNHIEAVSINNVDATIGSGFFRKSMIAVLVAAVLMVVYIAVRFKNIGGWSAGVMSIVALLHDVFMVFAVFVLLRIPLNDNFIAVVLTILGYSINDTIVIYDRIRENTKLLGKKQTLPEIVNLSINQSLRRAAGTTISTLIALGVVGVVACYYSISSIITLVIPMIIGNLSGLYSSICLTGPLWVWWEEKHPSFKVKKA